jgi:hypothetical protein
MGMRTSWSVERVLNMSGIVEVRIEVASVFMIAFIPGAAIS